MLLYAAQRIQNAQDQVIIQMPFALFGFLGHPKAHNELHLTLREKFSPAAMHGVQGVVIAAPLHKRLYAVETRFSTSVDSLKILMDYAISQELISLIPDVSIRKKFRVANDALGKNLRFEEYNRILELARR